MARIPRWAEKTFSTKCSLGGAVSTRPDEDINGWDYLVEFPVREAISPTETTPARRQAFAQIKSTTGTSRRITVKLSNMLKACNSDDPWFIFLVRKDEAIFGAEVIDELLARSLREVRETRLSGRPLNKVTLSFEFQNEDRVQGDVVEWMERRIGSSAKGYTAKKRDQFETKGYEDGLGTGKITITARNKEFKENLLGLGDGLKVDRFMFSDTRFGIPEPLHDLEGTGVLFIKPEPIDTCEIRLTGPSSERPIILRGTVYGVKPPMVAPSEQTLRFSAPPLEVLLSTSGGSGFLRADEATKTPLPSFLNHAKLLQWVEAGPMAIEVRRRGERVYQSTFKPDQYDQYSTAFQDIILAIDKIAARADLSTFVFSLSDLNEGLPGLHEAAILLGDRNLRLEATASGFGNETIQAVFYPVIMGVAEMTLAAIVERPVIEDVALNHLRRVTMGPPKVRETYAIENASERETDSIRAEFVRLGEAAGKKQNVLLIPDLMERVAEARSGNGGP